MTPLTPAVPHVVVLGAGYAGLLAALRVAGLGGRRVRVSLVNAVPHFVERIRLHEVAARGLAPRRSLERMVRGRGIDLVVGRVARIETESSRLLFEDGSRLSYDRLVLATGSGSANAEGHHIADEAAAVRFRAALAASSRDTRVVVVGGGATGIELASELAEQGERPITLVADGLAPALSDGARAYVRETLARLDVNVVEGVRVESASGRALVASDGAEVRADLVAWCTGFRASPLAGASGLAVDAQGRVRVDAALRSLSHPNVLACGDAAATTLRMACATALPTGAHAADTIVAELAGGAPRPLEFAYFVQCTSLGRERGLLQRVAPDDAPLAKIYTGRLGARLKEAVCRYTMIALELERIWPGTHSWARAELEGLDATAAPLVRGGTIA